MHLNRLAARAFVYWGKTGTLDVGGKRQEGRNFCGRRILLKNLSEGQKMLIFGRCGSSNSERVARFGSFKLGGRRFLLASLVATTIVPSKGFIVKPLFHVFMFSN